MTISDNIMGMAFGALIIKILEHIFKRPNNIFMDYDGDLLKYVGQSKIGTNRSDPGWRIGELIYDQNDNVTGLVYCQGGDYTAKWTNRKNELYEAIW